MKNNLMSEMPDQPVIPATPAPQPVPAARKVPVSISFGVALLLFIMPFIDVRCNDMSLKKVTGAELATGFEMKSPGGQNSLFDNLDNIDRNKTSSTGSGTKDANVYALAALVLAALGFLLSLTNAWLGSVGGTISGALGAVSLIALWFDLRRQVKAELTLQSQEEGVRIAVEFTAFFYLAIVAMLAAAYFSYKRLKSSKPLV